MSRQGRWPIKIHRKGKEKMKEESNREKSGARSFVGTVVEASVAATVVFVEALPTGSLAELAQL